MSLTRFLVNGQTPKQFGARRGEQWPALAIRRFMLYDVLLHELGHLQIVDDRATSVRRRFSMETKAQEFAMRWCKQLWAVPFDHSDAVHNKPTDAELADKEPETTHALAQVRQHPDSAELFQRLGKIYFKRRMTVDAKSAFEKSLVLDPRDPWSNLYLGKCHYVTMQLPDAVKCYARAAELMPDRSAAWWCLAEAYEKDRKDELADMHYRKAVEAEPSDKVARRKLTAWRQRLAHRGP
jgi:tetratricopeptide (TPR) repeat protein